MTNAEKIERALALIRRPENSEVRRLNNPEERPDWYQNSRPAQGVRTAHGDRSDWSGASARGQNWSGGGRER